MILIIDNYDSFVYNLARYTSELGYQSLVARNNKITLDEIKSIKPSHIIISPGPCTPNEAGISQAVIDQFHKTIPILGVCLGHQAIGACFGAEIIRSRPMHGKASKIFISEPSILFNNLPRKINVGRYHSLSVSSKNLSDDFMITAQTETQEVMAIEHKKYPTFGVQFHPESVLTEFGYEIINNFLEKTHT